MFAMFMPMDDEPQSQFTLAAISVVDSCGRFSAT